MNHINCDDYTHRMAYGIVQNSRYAIWSMVMMALLTGDQPPESSGTRFLKMWKTRLFILLCNTQKSLPESLPGLLQIVRAILYPNQASTASCRRMILPPVLPISCCRQRTNSISQLSGSMSCGRPISAISRSSAGAGIIFPLWWMIIRAILSAGSCFQPCLLPMFRKRWRKQEK